MPDIALRFHKDMLVLSSPIDTVLARQGVNIEQDRELINLIEPESVRNAYRLELVAGAQCLVTNTAGITRARLAHSNREDQASDLAQASLDIIKGLKPQHVFAEIGPTGLPLDVSRAASLKQNRDQYGQAAVAFGSTGFEAFFLRGMTQSADMQCALMGIRKVSDLPIIASLTIDNYIATSREHHLLAEALQMMEDCGADVLGLASAAPLSLVLDCVVACQKYIKAPLLVQLIVAKNDPKQQGASEKNPYYCPDTMIEAATQLRGAGVQFLRAEGDASPAYTGSLVVASAGFDVVV